MTDWHMDKRVSIAMIGALLMQSFTAVWWAASMDARMRRIEEIAAQRSTLDPRLTRLEVVNENQARTLLRIEDKLDRLIEENPMRKVDQ